MHSVIGVHDLSLIQQVLISKLKNHAKHSHCAVVYSFVPTDFVLFPYDSVEQEINLAWFHFYSQPS